MKRSVSLFLLGLMAILISACSSTAKIATVPREVPVFAQYNYDAANRCLRPHIEAYFRNSGDHPLLLINEIGDRTRNPRDPYSGALSWGGDLVFSSLVRGATSASQVALPFSLPKEALLFFAGNPLSYEDVIHLQEAYGATRILGITGGFTTYDQNRGSDGGAIGGTTRRNDLDLRLELGRTTEGGRVNLVIMIGDVVGNQLLASVRISGTIGRYSDTFKGTLEINGMGGGLSNNTVVLDGIHSVQENLIAAAHFYMWSALLPGTSEDDCLYDSDTSPSAIAVRMASFDAASDAEQIRLLKRAINLFMGRAQPDVYVDGVLDQGTWDDIRAVERRLGVLPHGPGDLGTLYQRLISSGSTT